MRRNGEESYMSIFAVTICGRKYYFACNLSENDISRVESYCGHLTNNPISDDINEQFESLLNYIREELKLPITPIRIEHVFRINFT